MSKKLRIQDYFNSVGVSLNSKILSFIIQDGKLEVIFKRAEKIKMALYLLADYGKRGDDTIKRLADEIIFKLADLFADPSCARDNLKSFNLHILKINSLIDSYYADSLISKSSTQVLKDALVRLLNALEESDLSQSLGLELFNEKDFYPYDLNFDYKGQDKGHNKGHIKDNNAMKQVYKGHLKGKRLEMQEGKGDKNNEISKTKNKSIKEEKITQSRRLKIVELLQSEPGLTASSIREKIFPELSQKTVQRELTAMLEDGLLKKEGQKRWTRYLLNLD